MTLTREARTIDATGCTITLAAMRWPNRLRTAWAILRGHTVIVKAKTITVLPLAGEVAK